MRFLVSGEFKSLSMVNIKSAIDWTIDFIEPAEHPEFKWNEDVKCYEIDAENFDWWKDVVTKANIVNNAHDTEAFKSLSNEDLNEYYSLSYDADLDTCYSKSLAWLKEHNIV